MADYVRADEVAIAPEIPEPASIALSSDPGESLLRRHVDEFL
jgi:hypothetical protein